MIMIYKYMFLVRDRVWLKMGKDHIYMLWLWSQLFHKMWETLTNELQLLSYLNHSIWDEGEMETRLCGCFKYLVYCVISTATKTNFLFTFNIPCQVVLLLWQSSTLMQAEIMWGFVFVCTGLNRVASNILFTSSKPLKRKVKDIVVNGCSGEQAYWLLLILLVFLSYPQAAAMRIDMQRRCNMHVQYQFFKSRKEQECTASTNTQPCCCLV